MLLYETDERFYIADSKIPGAGKGLFTKISLKKGASLKVIGILIPSASISDECTAYADEYKFRLDGYLLIPVGYGAFVNHSINPNMEKIIEGHSVFLRLLRDIEHDQELLWTYSADAQRRFALR